jgi:hypothetical protein
MREVMGIQIGGRIVRWEVKRTSGYSSTIFATSGATALHFSHHVAVPSRMVTPSYMTALRYSALEWREGISGVDMLMSFVSRWFGGWFRRYLEGNAEMAGYMCVW